MRFWKDLASTCTMCTILHASLTHAVTTAPPGAVDLGTTLVAVKFDRGVVVGSDTRTSQGGGYVSHRYAHKIVPITATTVLARSGSAADTQQLADAVRVKNDVRQMQYGNPLTVSQIAHWLRQQVYGENGGAGSVSLLVAGYDNRPRIYNISPSGALLEEPGVFAVSGSGSTYIIGHLDHQVADAHCTTSLDEQGAVELCQRAIELAVQRDGSSGGLIRLYVVTAEGRREVTVFPDKLPLKGKQGQDPLSLPGFAAAATTASIASKKTGQSSSLS